MITDADIYQTKARESLAVAQHALTNRHNNSCVNRCYYACFQAAVAVLLPAGHHPHDQWTHKFVQSRFAGELIARRKRYPARLVLQPHFPDLVWVRRVGVT